MPVQVFGTQLGYGFPGGYAANDTEGLEGRRIVTPTDVNPIYFGDPVVLVASTYNQQTVSSVASFIAAGGTFTAAKFAGVAVRELKGATNFLEQNSVSYTQATGVSYMRFGKPSVACNVGAPVDGGAVYIRVAVNAAIPAGLVGGFEAAADGANTVLITNAQWRSKVDTYGVATITIFQANQG